MKITKNKRLKEGDIMKKKLLLLTLSASSLLSTQPAFANDSQSDIEAKLNSVEWKGLKPAKNGGANIAHIDKSSLSADEAKSNSCFR